MSEPLNIPEHDGAASTPPTQPTQPTAADLPTATTSTTGAELPTIPAASVARRRDRPLFGTIFWGVLLLAFAAFMVVWTALPVMPDPTLWLLGGVIAIGVALVAAGIAAASRRAG
ncbi:hypothetical protein [Glaciibacter sp. 2TAF33]|uniref:hypothetical protein n=1 Tax=Glaciibacter sp. 2TAF33 TaxID=3233015 RepID=UPI003F92015C